MKQKLTQIKLLGDLGKTVGEKWDLAISSVGEAMKAIEILSEHKLFKYLQEKDKEGVRYKVFINNKQFIQNKLIDHNNIEEVKNCELSIKQSLESIEIVPVLEGSDSSTIAIVLGALLIVVGVILIATGVGGPLGAALVIGGLGLVAAGVINLLSSPPKFEDFREIEQGGATSYLFNGPQNVTREGGPIPVGYGRLIVGSQVISASYEISHKNASEEPLTR